MADWEKCPPSLYDIVTGYFPETSPKETWATNPRPLLVCGVALQEDTGIHFCRVAYGTSRKIGRSKNDDLVIGNLSILDSLGLKKPTRFVTSSGKQMAILPWTEEFFSPWTGFDSPVLSCLPEDIQKFVGFGLSELDNLPQF